MSTFPAQNSGAGYIHVCGSMALKPTTVLAGVFLLHPADGALMLRDGVETYVEDVTLQLP